MADIQTHRGWPTVRVMQFAATSSDLDMEATLGVGAYIVGAGCGGGSGGDSITLKINTSATGAFWHFATANSNIFPRFPIPVRVVRHNEDDSGAVLADIVVGSGGYVSVMYVRS